MIPLLQPLFTGRLAPLGEALRCADTFPAGATPLADLLHGEDTLTDAVRRYARLRGAGPGDLRPAASAWSQQYLAVLLPPVMAAASVLQHPFPVAAEEMAVTLDAHGKPVAFHLRHTGRPLPDTSTARRYEPLVWHHLAPLFTRLGGATRLAPKIAWGNAVREMTAILTQASAATGLPAIAADQTVLLHTAHWPGDDTAADNPLHAPPRVRQGSVTLYRHCCLAYLMPQDGYCGACPLDPRHRDITAEAPGP